MCDRYCYTISIPNLYLVSILLVTSSTTVYYVHDCYNIYIIGSLKILCTLTRGYKSCDVRCAVACIPRIGKRGFFCGGGIYTYGGQMKNAYVQTRI